jgi:hypothetical protein
MFTFLLKTDKISQTSHKACALYASLSSLSRGHELGSNIQPACKQSGCCEDIGPLQSPLAQLFLLCTDRTEIARATKSSLRPVTLMTQLCSFQPLGLVDLVAFALSRDFQVIAGRRYLCSVVTSYVNRRVKSSILPSMFIAGSGGSPPANRR